MNVLTGRAARQLAVAFLTCLLLGTSAFAQRADLQSAQHSGRGAVATYSKEFAKRFALPDPEPTMELSAPLHALELQISPAPHLPTANQCLLNVYLDSRLPLYYPTEGPVGTAEVDFAIRHFFVHPDKGREHWLSLAIEDRRHFGRIGSRFNFNSALATTNYTSVPKQGAFLSGAHREFHRELFPGIAYLRLSIGCPFPRWLSVSRDIHLWLKRPGGKDYTRIENADISPEDFEKLLIPAGFVERMNALEKSLKREVR